MRHYHCARAGSVAGILLFTAGLRRWPCTDVRAVPTARAITTFGLGVEGSQARAAPSGITVGGGHWRVITVNADLPFEAPSASPLPKLGCMSSWVARQVGLLSSWVATGCSVFAWARKDQVKNGL